MTVIIYLPWKLPTRIHLPTHSGIIEMIVSEQLTWQSQPELMWHFSVQGLPLQHVAMPKRELLPHVFTLIKPKARRLFSVALSVPAETGPGS